MSVLPHGAAGQGGGLRLRAAVLAVAVGACLLAIAGPAGPATAATSSIRSAGAAAAVAIPAPPTPKPTRPDQFGPPKWLPLRHDLNGGEIKVGCTYESHGSQFGYECGGHHDRWALDLISTRGTGVYAAGRGWAVDLTGKSGGSGYGNVIQVDHGNGMTTLYGHLSKLLIPPGGAWVTENTLIGLVGSTGTSSAPHLHFEKRSAIFKAAVDPGPLMACRAGFLVRYPQVAKAITWKGLPWGAITVASDGTDCATPAGTQKYPAGVVPQAKAAAPVTAPDDVAADPWANLVDSSHALLDDLTSAIAPTT